jgi:hypothetical protein
MKSGSVKQSIIWAGILMLVGVLALIGMYVTLSPWVWVIALGAAGVIALVVYLTDRSSWSLMIPAYVMLAIAVLIALVTADVMHDEVVAVFVLVVIAIPFLALYLRDTKQWWWLVPGYVLLAVALMLLLEEAGILGDALTASYVLFAIAIPFFVVYIRDRKQWWFLIPAIVLTIIGLGLLGAADVGAYIVPILLLIAGVVLIVRLVMRGRRA